MAVETRPTTRQGGGDGLRRPLLRRHHRPVVARCSARCATAATSSPTPRPGCWGPMITPAIKGGHEVTLPVAVEGAEVGDAIAIRIRDIDVTSIATASGNDRIDRGPVQRRPVLRQGLRRAAAPSRRGDGRRGHRRGLASAAPSCGAPASPVRASRNGYTIAFDDERAASASRSAGEQAEAFAHDAPHGARAAGELDPEPDPAVRAARPRRRRRADAAVHGPARDDARRSTCPTRTTPATSARSCSARRTPAPSRPSSSSSAPTATWTSTPSAPARS